MRLRDRIWISASWGGKSKGKITNFDKTVKMAIQANLEGNIVNSNKLRGKNENFNKLEGKM